MTREHLTRRLGAGLAAAALAAPLLVAGLGDAPPAGATTIASFQATGPLHTGRSSAAAALLANGEVLVAGGFGPSGGPLASAELYNPSDGVWTQTGDLPLPVARAAAVALGNGEVLVAGGVTGHDGALSATGTSELYNVAHGTWSRTGQLPGPTFAGRAALLSSSGNVLYAGGLTSTRSGAAATDAAYLYDTRTGVWSSTATLPLGVASEQMAALADGDVLVAGGLTAANGATTPLAEVYQASQHQWASAARMPTAVADATTALVGGGNVLVAGGETAANGSPTAATQLFDSTNGTWTSEGALPEATRGATASPLPSGGALYAGGLTSSGAPTSATALYNPGTGTWARGPDLLTARAFGIAQTLADHEVLVSAGKSASGTTSASELYVMASGTTPVITSRASVVFQPGAHDRFTVTATGSPAPKLTESGALPPGTSFNDNHNGTATISGTPPAGTQGNYQVEVTADNGAGAPVTQQLTITFNGAPRITSRSSLVLEPGRYSSFTVSATGSPAPHLSVLGALPPGIAFRPNANGTATVYGTVPATASGTYKLTVTANNGIGSPAVQTLTIVLAVPAHITSPATAYLRPGAYDTFTITTTGSPYPALSESGALPPGTRFRNNDNGTATIYGMVPANARGAYRVVVTAANGSGPPAVQALGLELSSPVSFTSPAAVQFQVGHYDVFTVTATGSPRPHLTEQGAMPEGLSFKDNGNGTATISGTPSPGARGSYRVTVFADNGAGAPTVQALTMTFVVPPSITVAPSMQVRPGSYNSFTVTATGSPVPRLSHLGTLPPGLSFRSNGNGTATISGTPSANLRGSYKVTIIADNGTGPSVARSVELTLDVPPTITAGARYLVVPGHSAVITIASTGSPTARVQESGELPPGMTFRSGPNGTAVISGSTPSSERGNYVVNLTAANGVGTPATARLVLEVRPAMVRTSGPATGYWYVTGRGQLIGKGSAVPIAPHHPHAAPRNAVALAATPGRAGYYVVTSGGHVYAYGDARWYGSLSSVRHQGPVTAMQVTPGDAGYYLVTRTGRVYTFGDARWYGSLAARRVPPIVAFGTTPDARGYWLVSSRGNVFAFGDAHFYGSPAGKPVPAVTGFTPAPDGRGYRLVTVAGNVYNYGDANFAGSLARRQVPAVVSITSTRDGRGYWLVTAKGNVFAFGDARFAGSSAGARLEGAVSGFAAGP